MSDKPLLSVVMPVYRGAPLLDAAFAHILALEDILDTRLEIIAVDDGSPDDAFAVITAWQKRHPDKIRSIRLLINYGAITAMLAGMDAARGDCVTIIPQDLQEPLPEDLKKMFAAWRAGEEINIGYRDGRDEPFVKRTMAAAYHAIFRALSGLHGYPSGGFGSFLIDRRVADMLKKHPHRHSDLTTRIFSLGGACLHPTRRLPPKTKTNWTFAKNIKLVIDNFIGFSYLPVRLMSLAGVVVALGSFTFACYVFVGKLTGWYTIDSPPGWATIVVLLTFLTGMVMLMLGVIGEYLWRIFDYVRGEPLYLIAETREENAEEGD